MAVIISTLDNAIDYINFLYEGDSTPPSSGEEDYDVWTGLLNTAVNLWENEEGVLWEELFIDLADAPDGDKTTDGTNTYDLPTLFKFPASGYVWTGSGENKTAYKVIRIKDKQLYENNTDNWCYFTSTKLKFNPNISMSTGETITYSYYKSASKLTTGSDTFEMSDPMFAVYYALSELKKEEGDTSAATIATQKLEGMKTKNMQTPDWQIDSLYPLGGGVGE